MSKIISLLIFVALLTSLASALTITLDSSGDAKFDNGTINQNLTSKIGDTWEFSYIQLNTEIELILPKNSEIISLTADSISTYNNRITLFSKDKIEVRYKILPRSILSPIYWISAILVIIVLIIAYYFYFIKAKPKVDKIKDKVEKKAKDKLEIIKKVLNEREKAILDNLKKSGKIKMSYLRKLTNIPKASFSRHVQELERKQLVKRTGEGKNKFVEIK